MENDTITKEGGLNTVQQSIKKYGRLRTFLDQIQAHTLTLLILIITLVFQTYNNSRFQKIEKHINQNINLSTGAITNNLLNNQSQNKNNESNANVGINTNIQGKTNLFNPDEWIIEGFEKDNEGFYCPIKKGYNYWSLWSKKKLPATFSIKLRLKVKSKMNKTPSTILSYGEYIENYSPKIYYRITFFDSDPISIRLYNENNKGIEQDWLKEKPNFVHEMIMILSPRVPDPKDRKININPSLIYNSSESSNRIEFRSKKLFSTYLPAVDLEDISFQNQLGIGIAIESCIKPLAIEF